LSFSFKVSHIQKCTFVPNLNENKILVSLFLFVMLCSWSPSQMYSGMFTHNIKPVLSMPQIEKLFGLLGYQPSSSRHEQLCLRPPAVGSASAEDLLCLSCAFFLARCECGLLLAALGKHGGEAQWELSAVRERQSGTGVQVCVCVCVWLYL